MESMNASTKVPLEQRANISTVELLAIMSRLEAAEAKAASAPDLLAALEALMYAVDPHSTDPDDVEPYFRAPMDAARAAIARARGEA